MRQGWREAGRDPSALYAVVKAVAACWPMASPTIAHVPKRKPAPVAVIVMHDLAEAEERRTLGYRSQTICSRCLELSKDVCPVHAQPMPVSPGAPLASHRLRPEEEPLATAELIKRLALTGTKQHLQEEIRALRDTRLCAICGPYSVQTRDHSGGMGKVLAGV